jgi:hypothetical protein
MTPRVMPLTERAKLVGATGIEPVTPTMSRFLRRRKRRKSKNFPAPRGDANDQTRQRVIPISGVLK